MYITINNKDQDQVKISFDNYGNIYLDDILTGKTYQVNIDGRNNLFFEEGSYPTQKSVAIVSKLHSEPDQSLKNIVRTHVPDDMEEAFDEDFLNQEEFYKHLEEEKYCYEDKNSDSEDELTTNTFDEEEWNSKFRFSTINEEYKPTVENRENEDICALYDTFVNHDGQIVFKSSAVNYYSPYRINILTSGKLIFRPVGSAEKHYKLERNHLNILLPIEIKSNHEN